MERTKAFNSNSGRILSYAWQETPFPCLEVEFKPTKKNPDVAPVYRYPGVPREKWQGLLHAPSAGQYLDHEIIPHYLGQKVRG